MLATIHQRLAEELNARPQQIDNAVQLLDDGATVPFIARYRKEVTGGLDDTQLRQLEQRLGYLRELEDRRSTILKSIDEQGKLTEALKGQINTADNKTSLEDLYLPYKPKRRTKGQIAIEAGLEPLAEQLFSNPGLDPVQHSESFLNPECEINDSKAALDGARFILMERFVTDAVLLQKVRQYQQQHALVRSQVRSGQEQAGEKFKDYFDYCEPLSDVPSHRALALLRGRNENILQLSLITAEQQQEPPAPHYAQVLIAEHFNIEDKGRPADPWLIQVAQWTWKVKLQLSMETELIGQLREKAESEAIDVFATNMKDLLMASPAGPKATMGLDPGLRTGTKVAVVDQTGKLVTTQTIYPHAPQKQWDQSLRQLKALCTAHQVELIAIGNGTASRETDKLATELLTMLAPAKVRKLIVSEAGASVYSASELAAQEFPQLDVSLRGAVSIARRLQDPLAELVKIDPKAIGVGQYQHDVNQVQLARQLENVVEDCVNAVGVDLNMASGPLLRQVSGLSQRIADNIVSYRDEHGAFEKRSQLKKVAMLGPKAFQQCAGFLRIRDGKDPLDSSAVHPESYTLVKRMSQDLGLEVQQLIGNTEQLKDIRAKDYIDDQFGLPTIEDILSELDKPGRDPRPEFKTAEFKEGVEKISDLEPDMWLEGVVSNVTNFGAFVDIGVHQDGLVHISQLADKFVSDPRTIVKAGDIVRVKVQEVDVQRKRIGLTMRKGEAVSAERQGDRRTTPRQQTRSKPKSKPLNQREPQGSFGNAFAEAFARQDSGKKHR